MKKNLIFWIAAILPALLGLAVLSVPGYRFSACVLFAITLVMLCYKLLGLLHRRAPVTANTLQRIFTLCLCLFLLAYAITGVVIICAAQGQPLQECDYLIVLGAGVNGTVPSLSLRERLDAAVTYLGQHPDTVCIVSGGQGSGEDITEAECMYRYLTEAGIREDQILQERQATSTLENITFSLQLIDPTSQTRIGILSSEYHLCRARMIARDQGIEPVMIPAETTWVSLRINYYLREVAGVWHHIILGG